MKTRRYRQIWTPAAIGALLLITPLVFGLATIGTTSLAIWLLGTVVGVVAIALALLWWGLPGNPATQTMTVLLGIILMIAPWVFAETSFTASAWTSSALGITLAIAAGWMLMETRSRHVTAPAYRTWQSARARSESRPDYRRVSSPL